ncbi:MAG: hypothetical protein WD035_02845 [Balneolaceae bacterium]
MARTLFILFIIAFTVSCSEQEPEQNSVSEKIDFLIEDDRYQEALALLDEQGPEGPDIQRLKEKTHLNYGLYNMNTFDEGEMRTRMNEALRQFAEVLRINPDNEVARTRIDQIMGVYETMPDRGPEEDVLEDLKEVGFNYPAPG